MSETKRNENKKKKKYRIKIEENENENEKQVYETYCGVGNGFQTMLFVAVCNFIQHDGVLLMFINHLENLKMC